MVSEAASEYSAQWAAIESIAAKIGCTPEVARCTVERLMRKASLRGVMRGKVVPTTVADAKAPCPLDRANRQFKAQRPNQLWVSDFSVPQQAA